MSDSENEIDPIRNGEMFENYLAAKKNCEKKKGKKDPKAKSAKEWTDDETSLLIDMLEANPCLWDIYQTDYSKCDLKEIAYTGIATFLDTNITSVKAKINSQRTQLGREMAKEKSTKSGQSTDELYASKWIHYDKLNFLNPVFGASKSRDTLKRMNSQEDESSEKEVTPSKRKTIAEKKLDLFSKCTEAITANAKPKANESPNPKISAFALYVDEKLSELNKRTRRIAEKCIFDVQFDMEMSTDVSTDGEFCRPPRKPYVGYNYHGVPRMPQAITIMAQSVAGISQQGKTQGNFDMQPQSGQSYVDMLNK